MKLQNFTTPLSELRWENFLKQNTESHSVDNVMFINGVSLHPMS